MEQNGVDYKNEKILIVDNDPYIRDTLEKLLSAINLSSTSAANGNDAFNLLSKGEYTIVLTDMKMPGMDGMELIGRVSSDFDISVIAMTGYSGGYKYVDVINAGATDFIKKPFGIEELEAKITRILAERNLRKELNRLSITDSLTELYNHRQFYSTLQDEIVRAKRQDYPLSLMLLDLDSFKAYNDNYGHLKGDEILRKAGKIISQSIREGVDSGYRYGGDEFAIILVDADMNIAKEIGTRIRKSFIDGKEITVSIGYSRFSGDKTVKDLVGEADTDLYKDKARS